MAAFFFASKYQRAGTLKVTVANQPGAQTAVQMWERLPGMVFDHGSSFKLAIAPTGANGEIADCLHDDTSWEHRVAAIPGMSMPKAPDVCSCCHMSVHAAATISYYVLKASP